MTNGNQDVAPNPTGSIVYQAVGTSITESFYAAPNCVGTAASTFTLPAAANACTPYPVTAYNPAPLSVQYVISTIIPTIANPNPWSVIGVSFTSLTKQYYTIQYRTDFFRFHYFN